MPIGKKIKKHRRSKKYANKRRTIKHKTKRFKLTPNMLTYKSRGGYGQETKTIDGGWAIQLVGGIITYDLPYPQDELIPNAGGIFVAPPRDPTPNAAFTFWQILPISRDFVNIQALNLIQQGAGIPNRIGNKISLKSLRLRLQITDFSENNQIHSKGRTMIIYDRQPSGNNTYPPTTTILQYINQNNQNIPGDMWASIGANTLERYTVLMDKLHIFPPFYNSVDYFANAAEVTATSYKDIQLDEFIQLRDLQSVYQSSIVPTTLTTILLQQIITGALYILAIGEEGATIPVWGWIGSYRLRFHDN